MRDKGAENASSEIEMSDTEENDIWKKIRSYQLSTDEIIRQVTAACRKQNVQHLLLFGSYAAGNPTPTSDIDFVVKGCRDILALQDEVDRIPTLTKVDLFDYDAIRNPGLKKDIDQYAKTIY